MINPSVCLSVFVSVCLSVREHISGTTPPIRTKFCVPIPCGRGRSSSGGVALRYVLPVLCITSRMAAMGATPEGVRLHSATAINDVAIPGGGLMSFNALLLAIGLLLQL